MSNIIDDIDSIIELNNSLQSSLFQIKKRLTNLKLM